LRKKVVCVCGFRGGVGYPLRPVFGGHHSARSGTL
jgi:hypothetical protein